MPYLSGFGGLVLIGLWIFAVIDVLGTPERQCRTLPKLAWVFLVLLLPPVGTVAWFVAGHPWLPRSAVGAPGRPGGRPGGRPLSPDDDPEFLAALSKRAEEQRRSRQERGDSLDGDLG